MYLLAKFESHRSYGNGDVNYYIDSCMDALEKAELTAKIHHIAIFSKSGIPIYNSEVLIMAVRKTRRFRKIAIANCFALHANTKILEKDRKHMI